MNLCLVGKQGNWPRHVLAGMLLCACVFNARAEESVQALRYGVTLFHFYQQDYFVALTELMAAQQLGQLDVHADGAEILRGGISLSYGMDRVAEDIFQNLLAQSADTVDRDQAWFYLGKMAWQRSDLERAGKALGHLSNEYSGALAAEADYLRASIDLRRSDEQGAASYLDRLPKDSDWRYYLYYNLGATRAAQGDWLSAGHYFSKFDEIPLESAESKALQDKAFTAAGFAHMADGEFELARGQFSRVRLDSPLSDRALLGYGWSSAELDDFRAALSPWQALGERSMLGESARESLLAVPYAYEKLGMPGTAMEQYRYASQVYQNELDGLHGAILVFRTQGLPSLLAIDNNTLGEWLFDADMLPEGEYAPYLRHLISGHGFQIALRELRDLYSIAGHLQRAGERLQVLAHVDNHQQEIWSNVMQGSQRDELEQRQDKLAKKVLSLRQRLDNAVAQGDSRLLADAKQSARWLRLDRAGQLAANVGADQEQLDKFLLLRGLTIWEDNENYPARVWREQREVQELENLAGQSRTALQQVDNAIAQRRQQTFAPRIAVLDQRVRAQSVTVEQVITVAEARVRELAVVELERQVDQLTRALGQTGLAIARLYDQGSVEVPR